MVATGQDTTRPGRPDNDYQFVYYDGNYNGSYECTTKVRPNKQYDPGVYNPNSPRFDVSKGWSEKDSKYVLPFERLESVIGVYVYSLEAFNNAVDDNVLKAWADADLQLDNGDYWRWMQANGQMLLFSRQTGMMMRNRDE